MYPLNNIIHMISKEEKMIDWMQTLILSIVQGITEFLPISSSAHLIILPNFFNWPDQGLNIDVAVHFGTLGAVLGYFYQETWSMTKGSFNLLKGNQTPGGKLFLQLSIATIPVAIVGFFFTKTNLTEHFRQIALIGWTSIIFGILLWFIDKFGSSNNSSNQMTYTKSFIVGLAQVLALIPGVSRSGICMTAMRGLGFNRTDTAKYACLMSIPTIIAAATLIGTKIYQAGGITQLQESLIAAFIAFLVGIVSIVLMMRWLVKSNFNIFVYYRVILGLILLYWAYF